VYAHREDFADETAEEPEARTERVAVVGGGPAGLTVADDLARLGYGVTIFEAMPFLGGALRLGVPGYRLPREMLDYEIEQIVRGRIEVRLECRIGCDITFEGLRDQGYAAIFVAAGAHQSRRLDVEGADAEGVTDALAFLRRVNLGDLPTVGRRVVVIGGGNVAVDAARCARRLGAAEVEMVCLEDRDSMPAHRWELEEALEEGVRIRAGWGPKRVKVEAGRAAGLECVRCVSVFDEEGRFRPRFDDAATCEISADTIVIAIGQMADLEGLPFAGNGRIGCDDSLATALPGVFAGGDAVLGPASLVEAMAHGHRAAEAIHRYLQGQPAPSGVPPPTPIPPPRRSPGAPCRSRTPREG
jgi:NADPH-dependent glutamate synthase beta subunit-like oxidoreductase